MTYVEFLAAFVVVPLAVTLIIHRALLRRRALLLITLIVYVATSPWDNAAVANGLWTFSESQILGLKVGFLPIEEYAFFGMQTWLVGLWVIARLERRQRGGE